MATKLGKWLNKRIKSAFRLVSVNAINTIMVQSDTSLPKLKEVAKTNAEKMEIDASKKYQEANKLQTEANILSNNSSEIQTALAELDSAEGK